MGEALGDESGGVSDEEGVVRVEDGAVEGVDGGEAGRGVVVGGIVFGESDGEKRGKLLLLLLEALHHSQNLSRSFISLLLLSAVLPNHMPSMPPHTTKQIPSFLLTFFLLTI